jgi:hypothetical protein
MSKFEINRITKELIRAILRFCFSFLPPKREKNNIQIYYLYIKTKMGGAGVIFEPHPPNFENLYNI